MTWITDRRRITTLAAGDYFPVSTVADGDVMRASSADVLAYIAANLTFPTTSKVTQNAAPLTGTTVVVVVADTWLCITPAGTIAALTITLPAIKADGQEVLVNSTQIITALTIAGLVGAPTTMAANGFFRARWNATLAAWYRVG